MDKGRTFGERLADWRKYRNLSQRKLADRAGLTGQAVSKLESGKTRRPALETVAQLAAALEISVSALAPEFGEETDARIPPDAQRDARVAGVYHLFGQAREDAIRIFLAGYYAAHPERRPTDEDEREAG